MQAGNQYAMEPHYYENSQGMFHEERWNMISHFPAQVGRTCAAHVVTDCIQYRYMLVYRRAGFNILPFARLSAQHLIDGAALKRDPPSKRQFFNMCLPQSWYWEKDRGGGLIDVANYNAPDGMRGEWDWNETVLRCQEENPTFHRYPVWGVKTYSYIFGKDRKVEKIVNALRQGGPLYGDFWIPKHYGTSEDEVNHAAGVPHNSYKPSKERIKFWRNGGAGEPASHAVLIVGTGVFMPWNSSQIHRYFVYRNSWDQELPGKDGFMRLFASSIASVWIPIIRSPHPATNPHQLPRAPDTWTIPPPDYDETSDSSSSDSSS